MNSLFWTGLEKSFTTEALSHEHDDLLARLLPAEIIVSNVESRRFARGFATADQVIATNRFILVRKGAVHYQVEDREARFKQGSIMLVPAWVRRVWRSELGCELIWCEFSSPPFEIMRPAPLFSRVSDLALEEEAFERLLVEWRRRPEPSRLLLEGELKAMLARFLSKAARHDTHASAAPATAGGAAPRAALRCALEWAEQHYARRDAFERMRAESALSPGHFRTLFRRQTGLSVGEYLLRLRMRHARFLLHESGKSVKEIARAVGYSDALYFSRCYRNFWGCAPTADRTRATEVADPRRTVEWRRAEPPMRPG